MQSCSALFWVSSFLIFSGFTFSVFEFLKVKKEIELKKEIEKENINFSREKNKSHEMSL